MKIALLTDSDVFAGTERHMLDLGLELRALGAEPTLVCPSAGVLAERGRAAGLPVFALEKRGAIDPGAVRQLARQWNAGAFEVVHAHNGRTALLAALGRHVARRGALVATQHFLSPSRSKRRGLARLAGGFLHGVADLRIRRHIAISQAVADAMLARQETAPGKVRVVLNGIRDPREQTLAPRAQTRARFDVPEDAPLIVCLARLDPEKGVDTLIDAMAEAARRLPGARCLIAGHGSLEAALRERIDRLGSAAASVRLVGFQEDSLSLVEAADLFVLPSLAEPFGLSIVEAMALGKPVIATRAGGPLEIVREGESGHLVLPGDPAALAAAIAGILSQPGAAARMGAAARADFLARFTARRMAGEILAVYQEALRA
jgi:glycosyltransferase involved in cell wall biosynthesis